MARSSNRRLPARPRIGITTREARQAMDETEHGAIGGAVNKANIRMRIDTMRHRAELTRDMLRILSKHMELGPNGTTALLRAQECLCALEAFKRELGDE